VFSWKERKELRAEGVALSANSGERREWIIVVVAAALAGIMEVKSKM